jgi:hypothetical protein
MSKETAQSAIDGSGYGDEAFYGIIKHQYQKLRARLMNLAETLKDDLESRKALKGIFHDYLDQAHYNTQEEIQKFMMAKGHIPPGNCSPAPILKGFEEEII